MTGACGHRRPGWPSLLCARDEGHRGRLHGARWPADCLPDETVVGGYGFWTDDDPEPPPAAGPLRVESERL